MWVLSTVQEPRVTANGSRENCGLLLHSSSGATSGQKVVWTTAVSWVGSCYIPFSVLLTMRLSQGKVSPIPATTNGSPSRSALHTHERNPDNGRRAASKTYLDLPTFAEPGEYSIVICADDDEYAGRSKVLQKVLLIHFLLSCPYISESNHMADEPQNSANIWSTSSCPTMIPVAPQTMTAAAAS